MRPSRLRSPAQSGRSQRYVLLAAAALALVAILGVIAVGAYLRRAAESDLPTSVIPTPPVAVITSRPGTPTATIGETWDADGIEDSATGRSITAVAIAGTTLVGVGRGECLPNFSDPTACYGAAWTDVGGAGWTAAPNQPGLEMGLTVPTSGPERSIYDVANGPAGFVAVGYDYNPPRSACAVAPCTTGPAVWRSADGQTWERVHLDLGPGIVDRFSNPIVAITADDRGYVMVGYAQTLAGDGQFGPAHAAAWTSPDGIDWTRATDSDDMDVGLCVDTGEEPSCGGMLDVAAMPTGFVAVGHAMNGNAGQRSARRLDIARRPHLDVGQQRPRLRRPTLCRHRRRPGHRRGRHDLRAGLRRLERRRRRCDIDRRQRVDVDPRDRGTRS